jgi:hypothetical protein
MPVSNFSIGCCCPVSGIFIPVVEPPPALGSPVYVLVKVAAAPPPAKMLEYINLPVFTSMISILISALEA